jgi:hypothetical protein
LFLSAVSILLFGSLVPAAAQEAGEVSALLPLAHIERGSASPVEAKLQDAVFWQDWFETEDQARARLALVDGSLLNVGSSARVQVVRHDQASEQTELELKFGKVRAEVKERTQSGGQFEVRTDTAVIGVIGTHLFIDGAAALTTVINFDGKVKVSNLDPNVEGEEVLEPFELAEIEPGLPPRKRWATLQELLQALEDTLPGPVLRLFPRQARAGSCVSEPVKGLAGDTPQAPDLGLTPRGCTGPDIAPVKICVPEAAKPGVYEYALEAADGTKRFAAFLVEPQAPLQDAWLVFLPELPVGATHTARLLRKETNEPLARVPIHIRHAGREQTVETDEQGGFVLEARQRGVIEVELNREGGGQPPFEELKPIKVSIQVVEKIDQDPKVPEYTQRGTLVSVKGEVEAASLGDQALPILKTVMPRGKTLSSFPVPQQIPEGARSLNLTGPGGQQRQDPVSVYDIIGGRLDQHALSSGVVTQGEFLVCVGVAGGASEKVKARIAAIGPVHFRGRGAKGKRFEQTFTVASSGLLRIPFQIQAEKGSPTGIPFSLTLRLQRD